jgi:hypothetical protein
MFLRRPLLGEPEIGRSELKTFVGHVSKFQIPGLPAGQSCRIWPGDPTRSSILYRMQTRNPFQQMPPLGTRLVDQEAIDVITGWIKEDLGNQSEEKE